MKKVLLTGIILVAMAGTAVAGSIRVYNSDSKDHKVKLECSGSDKTIEIRGSTTATYTFHSTNDECDIVGGTVKFPTKKLKDGQKWKIDDGEAEKN